MSSSKPPINAYTEATAPWTISATTGTCVVRDNRANGFGARPSRLTANGTRAPDRIEPFIADKAEIVIASASTICAPPPRNVAAVACATELDAATSANGSA